MAIIGITQTEDGQAIQRLSVSTKVAVGLPPDSKQGRKAPIKLDFFIFLRKTNRGDGLNAEWEIDPELTKHYGKEPRELDIILLDDDIEHVFPTKLAWWNATQCLCWGNGLDATRRTKDCPDGEAWQPCGKACPDLQEGRCKPSGDMFYMLADFPKLGSVARTHTTSYRSIQQISSAIQQVRLITGGRLAGIKAKLVVRPEKTSYQGNDGKRHSTIIPALSLEVTAPRMKELVSGMVQTAQLFEVTKRMLGAGSVQVIEDETEKADELSKEFYNLPDDQPLQPRVNRRERERGTLEPGKSENRGHGKEGFSQFVEGEQKQEKKENTDWTCNECRATNGHLPTCKYHAEWKAKLNAKDVETDKPAKEKQNTDRELMAITVENFLPKLKKLTPKQLKENLEAKNDKQPEPHEPKPYFDIIFNGDQIASVWDTNLHEAIMKSRGKKCTFAISRSAKGYISIEEIIDIASVKFARDPETRKAIPLELLATTERAIKNMEEGKTAAGNPIQSSFIESDLTMEGSVVLFVGNLQSKEAQPRPYVYIDIETDSGARERFLCVKPELFQTLSDHEGELISVRYSKDANGRFVEEIL